MEQAEIIKVTQEAVFTILKVAGPVLIIGLVVGVIISIFQATTQINEQSLAFVPKIILIFLSIVLFGGWMLTQLTDFTNRLFESINIIIK